MFCLIFEFKKSLRKAKANFPKSTVTAFPETGETFYLSDTHCRSSLLFTRY